MKWSGLFLESFKGQMLSKNKVQWFMFIMIIWSNILSLVWVFQRIIIGLSSVLIMRMVMFAITNPL
jgi:hypothetical protein